MPIGRSRARVLASPGYLAAHGTPKRVADLAEHSRQGVSQPESLNAWPQEDADGQPLHIQPAIRSFSGETLRRRLALNDAGIVCLSNCMTRADRQSGALRPLFPRQTLDARQLVNAVYYRNTAISSRIKSFIDYLVESLGPCGVGQMAAPA